MKTILLAVTVAAMSLTFSAPIQAATSTPALSLQQLMSGSVERGGHRCDNPDYAATHPRCSR